MVTELKTVDQPVKQCPGAKLVLVSMRTNKKVPMTALDLPLEKVRGCPTQLPLPPGQCAHSGSRGRDWGEGLGWR